MTITEQDTKLILQVLDVASTRGAFRANEMLAIGTLHKKLADSLPQPEMPAEPQQEKKS